MMPLLQGTQVLEIGSVVLGPYAAQVLADLGADVVKLEPLEGDIARASQPAAAGMGALYVNNNRNKRAIAVDLKRAEGREILARLVARSAIVMHNMRPEAAERLGLGFDAVAAINPDVIHCAMIGFGSEGRHRDRPAFDDTIQGASGMAGLLQQVLGEPRFAPTILADKVTALHAVYAVLAALVARASGQVTGAVRIEVPMFEATAAFLLNEHLAGATFAVDGRPGYDRVLAADRRPFRTADGWLAVLPYTDRQWRRFLVEIGREDIVGMSWFGDASARQARVAYLYGVIAEALPARTTEAWVTTCTRLDIPASRINRLEDLLEDPHLADVGFFSVGEDYPPHIVRAVPQPVRFHGCTRHADRPPPALGAHTRDVLRECGFADADVDRLLAGGVAATAPVAPLT